MDMLRAHQKPDVVKKLDSFDFESLGMFPMSSARSATWIMANQAGERTLLFGIALTRGGPWIPLPITGEDNYKALEINPNLALFVNAPHRSFLRAIGSYDNIVERSMKGRDDGAWQCSDNGAPAR